MRFMTTWTLKPQHFDKCIERFLKTGGPPPAGVKMLGRWHGVGQGFVLSESNDAKAVYAWLSQWADVLEFTITPVVEDAEAADVLQKQRA